MLFEDDSGSRAGACSENNILPLFRKNYEILRFAQNDSNANIMFAPHLTSPTEWGGIKNFGRGVNVENLLRDVVKAAS